MIDTIGFKVPIDMADYESLLKQMIMTQRVDKKEGIKLFEYHNSNLDFSCPSWSYPVRFKITDEYWEYHRGSKHPFKAKGIPHIVFEFSVPKVLFGHNLFSADPCLIYQSMHLVRDNFEKLFGVLLLSPNEWYIYRLDTASNYILEDEKQGRSFISYLQRLNYPRKPKAAYEDTGLYFPSRQQTLKIYLKGPEFKKHDLERFKNEDKGKELLYLAQKIVRLEVEHRKRIRYLTDKYQRETGLILDTFEGYPRMIDFVEMFDFAEEMNRITGKMLCGTESKVIKTMDAYSLLQQKFTKRQTRTFHHIYMIITTQGQKEARKIIPEGTYYRAIRAFRETGVSLITSDGEEEGIYLDRGFPADFSLEMSETNKYYQKPLCECPPLHEEGEPF